MITVDYHGDLAEVQGDLALAALLRAPQAAAPFDRIEWWHGLSAHCGMFPLIAVARDGPSRAVLPLMRRGRQLHGLANWYAFRIAPLFTPGADRAALLCALAHDLRQQSGQLVLAPLPDEDGTATALAAALRKAGWATFMAPCDRNHVLPVRGRSFDEYLAGRPGALRTTLRRKAHRVEVTIDHTFNETNWTAYEAIYAHSWKGAEGNPAFLRHFAAEEGRAGRLRLGLARVDGQPVAAQFWTVEGRSAFIHKLAHAETAKALSPGTALTAALMKQVIDRDRVTLVDFGTGDDPYKRDWMEQVRPRYRIEAFRAERPANWPAIGRKILRRLAGRQPHG